MKSTFRSFTFGIAIILGIAAFAQPAPPYNVTVVGSVADCLPNSSVYIEVIDTVVVQYTVALDSNCSFQTNFDVWTYDPTLLVYTPCNGINNADTLTITMDPFFPDSNYVSIALDCGNGNVLDCLGVPNGPAQPGTPCNTALGVMGTWSASCNCVANTASCNACFTVEQTSTPANGPIPFSASFTSCSTGGVAPYTYAWTFDGGITFVNDANPVIVFTAGVYAACLTIADANGCTSTTCDSLMVDANGTINPTGSVDCLGVPNGPNVAGAPCFLLNEPGTWNTNCVCVPDSSTAFCQAGFWALQAYTIDSLNPNGSGTPIPNEVWVWNLSTGTGNISYMWDFGDGATSTDAFPTHVYANEGPYLLCLTMADDANCTSVFCDTLSLDANGILQGMIVDGNNHGNANNSDRAGFTLNVLQELPTVINEQERFEEIALWPNPVTDAITLSLLSTTNGRLDVSILDLNGRLINTLSNTVSAGKNRVTVPVEQLESGIYVVRISDGSTTVSRRFVKQ